MNLLSLTASNNSKNIFKICSSQISTSVSYLVKPNNLKGRNNTSQKWLCRQLNDPYVNRAKLENFRCRSAFKLLEIDDRYHVLKDGYIVLDCGASPGSWTQVAIKRTNPKHNKDNVIAVDLQHIQPIEGAKLLTEQDIRDANTHDMVFEWLKGRKVDVFLSDMAPNASGVPAHDHDVIIRLVVDALKFACKVLTPGGTFVCKIWQGRDQNKLEAILRRLFASVKVVKPMSSRTDSAEVFLLAQHFRSLNKVK